ncbi:membrane protein RL11R [Cercopithecine betaherpesvirus 5]|uniref:Membrane protein RL11R n=1 Tax=Simian cytomegalovirus (strain Colburn) TaxID=50292 RepID=G8XTR8_SCMVC|nr:membrane protein RL11R [Cercopithecine betaherpesvirus 5]
MWHRMVKCHIILLYLFKGHAPNTLRCKHTWLINATVNTNVTLNGTMVLNDCSIGWYRNYGAYEPLCQYDATKSDKMTTYKKIHYTCQNSSLIIFNVNRSASGEYFTYGHYHYDCLREKICYKLIILLPTSPTVSTLPPLTNSLITFEKQISPVTTIWSTLLGSTLSLAFAYLVRTAYHYWRHGYYYVPQLWRRRPSEHQTYRLTDPQIQTN